MDDGSRKRGGWLGRAVVVVVLWVLLASAAYFLVVVLPGRWSDEQPQATQQQQAAPPKASWTPEEAAAEPRTYLVWLERKARENLAAHRTHLDGLLAREADLRRRAEDVIRNVAEVQNVHDRMEQGVRRAEDEGRWPVRVMGRSFDREKALRIIEDTERYLRDRAPLATSYEEAMAKLRENIETCRSDTQTLERLAEQLTLELERVQINPSGLNLASLRRIEAQIDDIARIDRNAGVAEPSGTGAAPQDRREADTFLQ